MAIKRDSITMSEREVRSFLESRKTMVVATVGADGRPHVVAMWYGFQGETICFWTFAKSQKAVNLRRDPRVTVLVESGETYEELRGVELICTAELVEDLPSVLAIGRSVTERYSSGLSETELAGLERVATKRVGIRLVVERTVSWDHSKLGGVY